MLERVTGRPRNENLEELYTKPMDSIYLLLQAKQTRKDELKIKLGPL